MKKIVILVPCYNEDEVLCLFYNTVCEALRETNICHQYIVEFLFINDGSTDGTLRIMKKFYENNSNVSYLNLSRNFGKEVAMLAGLDYIDSDAVILMDADLQDAPELIALMITEWENGGQDVYVRRSSRAG